MKEMSKFRKFLHALAGCDWETLPPEYKPNDPLLLKAFIIMTPRQKRCRVCGKLYFQDKSV